MITTIIWSGVLIDMVAYALMLTGLVLLWYAVNALQDDDQ